MYWVEVSVKGNERRGILAEFLFLESISLQSFLFEVPTSVIQFPLEVHPPESPQKGIGVRGRG